MDNDESKQYLYEEYRNNIINIYNDERLEIYYYPEIKRFLQTICSCNEKVVNVSENKKKKGIHAIFKSKYTNQRTLQDLIFVPKSYSYEEPLRPYITVEIKRPDIDIKDNKILRYNKVKVKNNIGQLQEQFNKTSYIILTDSITWHLLTIKGKSITEKEFSLVEVYQKEWQWKKEENELLKEDENESNFWVKMIRELEKFLKQSIKNY